MILGTRRYKSGTRWCAWRWTDVVLGGLLYLRRLHLVQTPWFAIMLHWIVRPDPQPDMHDHPVSFVSLLVRGWYVEHRPDENDYFADLGWEEPHVVRRLNVKRATDRHRIVEVSPGGALTLVFAGPVVRSWGFHTPRGWVSWREYQR